MEYRVEQEKWDTKVRLQVENQSLLFSWGGGGQPCNWVGTCDELGSLTHLNLSNLGLRGTL